MNILPLQAIFLITSIFYHLSYDIDNLKNKVYYF